MFQILTDIVRSGMVGIRMSLNDSQRRHGRKQFEIIFVTHDSSILLLDAEITTHIEFLPYYVAEMLVARRCNSNAGRAMARNANFERNRASHHFGVCRSLQKSSSTTRPRSFISVVRPAAQFLAARRALAATRPRKLLKQRVSFDYALYKNNCGANSYDNEFLCQLTIDILCVEITLQ